jgi:hypothetical protein
VPNGLIAHDSPDAVFSAYAQALNRADFCEAIGFYEEGDRVDAALLAFRTLVLTAGAQGAKQAEYALRFSEVCEHYGLDYAEPSVFVGLFLSLLHDDDWMAPIANVRRIAERDPTSFYVNVMRRVHEVQPTAALTIPPKLDDLSFGAEVATARASRSDGKALSVAFRQAARGWVLTPAKDTL